MAHVAALHKAHNICWRNNMETRANHVLIGAFTLAVLILSVLFALWAANFSSNKQFNEFDVVFIEAVTGLSKGSIVQYNGIAVGEVRKLSLDKNDPGKVIARVRVDAETPVKVDTKAKLAFVGLTGVAQIQFSGGKPESALLIETSKQPIPVIIAEESAFAKLLNSTEDITTTAADVLIRINRMLSDSNVNKISKSLDNIEQITGTVANQKQDIASLLTDARTAAAKLDSTLAKADNAMGKLDKGMDSLDKNVFQELPQLVSSLEKTLKELEKLSTNANGLVEDNREQINSFTQQGLTQVGPTLSELRALIKDLNRLSTRLNENPAGVVLGRNQPEEFKP
jgi:phospholipid/cholesterol/gamma-HCH transport system substrate-binding protein